MYIMIVPGGRLHHAFVTVVDPNGVDGADPGREFRVEFCAVRHFAYANIIAPVTFDLFATLQDRFPGRFVFGEAIPLRDALEHTDASVAVVLYAHGWGWDGSVIGVAGLHVGAL